MNIEIHSTPAVPEEVVSLLKKQLMGFRHLNKSISRAEVTFRDAHPPSDSQACEIRLSIFGDSLYTMRKAPTFKKAVILALRHLETILKKQVTKGKGLNDEIVSSVKV